jgi:hypothetical protein
VAENPVNPSASVNWSPKRWLWTIGALFTVQVLSAWYWLDRHPLVSQAALIQPRLNLSSPQPVDPVWQPYLQLADPSVLARASRQGFSGAAWLNPERRSPAGWSWVDTNQGLGLNAQELPDPRQYWIQPKPSWSFVAEKPAPFYTEFSVPAEIADTNSFTQVEGNLQRRLLVAADPLPVWAHPEVLKDTVLQVVVSAAGGIVSARLDAGSGLEAADQCALRWTKNARFQPLPEATLGVFPVWAPFTSGQVVFHWGATNLPATNQPPAKS